MRFIVVLFLLFCLHHTGYTSYSVKDSLLQQLAQEPNIHERCMVLRNLADISYDSPDEKVFLNLLIIEATKANNEEMLLEATGNLVMTYALLNQNTDSVSYYMKQLELMDQTENVECWKTYLKMYSFNYAISAGDGTVAINDILKKLETEGEQSIYSRIANAYILANSFYTQDKFKQALPYAVNAEKLAAGLPFKDGYKIHILSIRLLSNILVREGQSSEAIRWTETSIDLLERYYEQYYKAQRPYYYINSLRIAAYATLMINVRVLPPKKADYYFQKVVEYKDKTSSLFDKYSCYFIMNNYYLAKSDWEGALETSDSLFKYGKTVAPYNIPGIYELNAKIYEMLGKYKESLSALKTYHFLQDSVNTQKAQEHLNELQVRYDVNQLNYEKSQLEIRNKQMLLIGLLFILTLLAVLCTYLYKSLKKERAMKEALIVLNAKAEESEKMKTVFIHSVCHEIRTPLNAIVGFSDLLCMPDLDDEMRQSFPEEIHKNSILLTSLISRMLEVSELDVSNKELPVEPTDIHSVCVQSMERIQDRGRKEIEYILDIPVQPVSILTNVHYLTLVLENLLDNADKFTEKGHIILHYEVDEATKKLLISITDTGIGIPSDMHEKVFERFSKLDAYKPGNGLGLYLCRLVMKRLSGDIRIDTTYAQGTRIWVELPVRY